ncbi:MAG: hypothetical protein Kow00128_16380 [Deltaproteobacteria bacterium]
MTDRNRGTDPAGTAPPYPPAEGTSSAEGQVDRIVRERFFPEEGRKGIFVDVGAARPDYLSISALYRSLGWRVLAVEPNPEFVRIYRERGHEIFPYACGNRDEDEVEFVVVDSHGAGYRGGHVTYESFSSLGIRGPFASLGGALDRRTIRVPLRRLDTILREHAPDVERIDILSVDVEGWELEVLEGLDLERYRPGVLILENYFSEHRYRAYLRRRGYLLWRRIAPNDLYVPADRIPGRLRKMLYRCRELFVSAGRYEPVGLLRRRIGALRERRHGERR